MRAALWNESGTLDVVERDLPEVLPSRVRLAVGACGICGSDLHSFRRSLPALVGLLPGHEVAGYVDLTGDDVVLDHGALVGLEPLEGCGTCPSCRGGRYNQCRKRQFYGLGLPGGMAEFVSVPARLLHAFPKDFPIAIAGLCEPFAVCVRGVRRGGVALGERVAILGAGSIGLLSIVAARAAGASEVFITARHSHQAELARHLGAAATFVDGESLLKEVGEERVDVVIETVGGEAHTMLEAARIARHGGTIVVLGVFAGATPVAGFLKELTIVGSLCYAFESEKSDFGLAVELLVDLKDEFTPLVTHHFPLDGVNEAFETAADKSTGSIKVQINP